MNRYVVLFFSFVCFGVQYSFGMQTTAQLAQYRMACKEEVIRKEIIDVQCTCDDLRHLRGYMKELWFFDTTAYTPQQLRTHQRKLRRLLRIFKTQESFENYIKRLANDSAYKYEFYKQNGYFANHANERDLIGALVVIENFSNTILPYAKEIYLRMRSVLDRINKVVRSGV